MPLSATGGNLDSFQALPHRAPAWPAFHTHCISRQVSHAALPVQVCPSHSSPTSQPRESDQFIFTAPRPSQIHRKLREAIKCLLIERSDGKNTRAPTFTVALCTVAETRKRPKSVDKWIRMPWCSHTVECYSATKDSEMLPFVTAQVGLKGITLSTISQSEKNRYRQRKKE